MDVQKPLVIAEAKSELLTLNGRDWKKILISAVLGSLLGGLMQLSTVDFSTIDRKTLLGIISGCIITALSETLRRLFTQEQGIPLQSTAAKDIIEQVQK